MARAGERRGLEVGDAPEDPPLQVLYPNLDRISRSAFRKGTLSRRRIVLAAFGMLGVAIAIGGLIAMTALG